MRCINFHHVAMREKERDLGGKNSHYTPRPRLDYDQQFCRDWFLLLFPGLWTTFIRLIPKSFNIKETRWGKSAVFSTNCSSFISCQSICMARLANKHTFTVLCIKTHSRYHKPLLIRKQTWQNIMELKLRGWKQIKSLEIYTKPVPLPCAFFFFFFNPFPLI